MTRYIIDASATGPLIIPDEADGLIKGLPEILECEAIVVPSHWRLEVANLALMAVRRKRMSPDLVTENIALMSTFDIVIDDQTVARAWHYTLELASRHTLTAYDAAYLELGLRLSATLITQDRKLAAAGRAEQIEVITQ